MKLPSFRLWRTLIPLVAFMAILFLLSRYTYPLPAYTEILLWYTRLDPLLLFAQLSSGAWHAWFVLPLLTLAFTLLLGRIFCGWLCPLGGLLALLHAGKLYAAKLGIGRSFHGAPPDWLERLQPYRYPWLLFLLALLALGISWPMLLSPFHVLTEELGLLWQRKFPWLLAAILASGLVFFPRFWCVYLCPTGLLLSWIAKWRRMPVRQPDHCTHCGVCQTLCPTGAAKSDLAVTSAECLLCGRCSEKCPAGSFTLGPIEHAPEKSGTAFSRREILRGSAALAVAGATLPILSRADASMPLRPPGALDEAEFLARCSRCGRCIKVCPSKCLKSMPLASGPAKFLTPYIVAREARCELTQDCQRVCPTGAIARVPIANTLMGLAEIDRSRCLGWAEGKLCLLCQEQCPQHAIDSDEKDRPSVRTKDCVGCGACENGCPLEPAAIVVKPQAHRRR